jgi:hypothetical protein
MAMDTKKRQKKLARKTAKRKQALAQKKHQRLGGPMRQITAASQAPLHECLMPAGLFETGIGNVIVSRTLPSGQIAAAFFLVDVFCLGVKDTFFQVMSPADYAYRTAGLTHEQLARVEPARARQLIEEAVTYAHDLGLAPHRDYKLTRQMLGDIAVKASAISFQFGKDGKPFFMSGPYDTPAKIERIIRTLTDRVGPEGFDYVIALGDPDAFEDFEDEGED